MLLARICTSTPDLVLDLKRELRAAGYLVEMLRPEEKSKWTADLPLRVETLKCPDGEHAHIIHVEDGTDPQGYSSIRKVIERDRIARNTAKHDHPVQQVPPAAWHSGLLTFSSGITKWMDAHAVATALALTVLVAVLTMVLSMRQVTTESSGAVLSPESFTEQVDSAKVAPKLSAVAAVQDHMDSSRRTEMGKAASTSKPAMAEEDKEVIVRYFAPVLSHSKKISRTRDAVKKFSDLD